MVWTALLLSRVQFAFTHEAQYRASCRRQIDLDRAMECGH
jgi:hypothetical protein